MRARLEGAGFQALCTAAGFAVAWSGNLVLGKPRAGLDADGDGLPDLSFMPALPFGGTATVGADAPLLALGLGCTLLALAAVASLRRDTAARVLGEVGEFLTLFLGALIGGGLALGGVMGMLLTSEAGLRTGHWGAYAYAHSVVSLGLLCWLAGNLVRALAVVAARRPGTGRVDAP